MVEEWRTIGNHQNYEISRRGFVRRKGKKKHLKPTSSNGHDKVSLDGKTEYVSRLVAKSFLDKPQFSNEILHINKDLHDNRVSNLEWATHSEIEDHVLGPYATMKMYSNKPKPVIVIETGEIFESIRSCAKHFNSEPVVIRRCLHNKVHTYKGLHFSFIEK